jgi:hypothetical protein
VTVIVLVLVGAVAIGWLRGGSFDRLAQLPMQQGWLVVAAAALTALGANGGQLGLPSQPTYVGCTVAAAGLVVLFVVRNRTLVGVPLMAVGFALNAVVIVANGAMPVSQEAAAYAGVEIDAILAGDDARHELLDDRTRLRLLADVIAVPLPGPLSGRSNVVSAGDVVLAAGIGHLVAAGMMGNGVRRRTPWQWLRSRRSSRAPS